MPDIRMMIHGVRLIGIQNALRAVRNSFYRDALVAKYLKVGHPEDPIYPGNLVSVTNSKDGVRVVYQNSVLSIQFLKEDLVFLGWDGAEMYPSYALVEKGRGHQDVEVVEDGDTWRIEGPKLRLILDGAGGIRFTDHAGSLIRREGPPEWLRPGWSQRIDLEEGSCVCGLGERSSGLNLRPGQYRLWNTDAGGSYKPGELPLYITMPVYVCLQVNGSHLVFYDNTCDGMINIGGSLQVNFTDGPLRYYVAVGAPGKILSDFTGLTGRAPLPPRWALGYHQSQWGYRSEAEMRRVYSEFKRHELPLSVLTLDADHMRGYRTMTLDEERYPTLKRFAELLAEEDVHLVASVNPAVKIEPGLELYEDGTAQDVFCKDPDGQIVKGVVWPGWTAFPDFTNQRVRDWFGSNYTHLLQRGIDGFWHDMNEPQSFTAWGDPTIPLVTQHKLEGRGGDHREAHNVYGLLMNRAGYEGLRKLQPGRRPFILSRSGWVGMQRYSWTWTGDVQTSWVALKHTIPTVLNIGLCGMPYDGPDIGGFSGEPSPELFVRWFQLSTFLPFYRTHSAFYLPRREPWEWGETVLPILRDLLRLRYRLMPYWYTAAWKTSQTGEPIVRPLFWDQPQNPDYWEIEDAYLLGDSLLVAPVVTEGSRERTVHLPPGYWHDFWGETASSGSGQVSLDAPLSKIPVLVRGGSILPMEEGDRLELHVYAPEKDRPLPGSVWTGDLYSDAGDGYGAHRVDRLLLSSVEDGYMLDWQAEGEYAWPYAAVTLHLHGFGVDQVIVNGEGCPLQDDACEVPHKAQVRIICQS